MTAVQTRLIATGFVFAALVLLGFTLLPLLRMPPAAPDTLTGNVEGAQLAFDFSTRSMPLPTSCYEVGWNVRNIQSITLNDAVQPASGAASLCGPAVFVVTFLNGSNRRFDLTPDAAIDDARSLPIGIGLALVTLWQSLHLFGVLKFGPLAFGQAILAALFARQTTTSQRVVVVLALAMLFSLGVFHWLEFFDYGNVALDTQDWRLTRRRWDTWTMSLEQGVLPYFTLPGIAHSERFIGDPDQTLTPLLLLTPQMSPATFALVNVLLLYAVGFAGCLGIKRRFGLSAATFTMLFLLFNFNGFITAHLGVGHFTFLGYFLLPFLVLSLFRILDTDDSLAGRAALGGAVALAVMGLLGSFHLVIWWVLLLGLVMLFNPSRARPLLLTIVFGLLLTSFRYVPAALSFGESRFPFRTGFPTLTDLIDGLVTLRDSGYSATLDRFTFLEIYKDSSWWEYDMYLGVAAALFVLGFGILIRLTRHNLPAFAYRALDLPIFGMALLSMGTLYEVVTLIPLPLLASERVTSRFFIVPLLLLVVIACIRWENSSMPRLREWRWQLGILGVLWLVASNLGVHSYVWAVPQVEARWGASHSYPGIPDNAIVDLTTRTLTPSDQFYMLSIPAGIALTILTALVWVFLYIRLAPNSHRPMPPTPVEAANEPSS